MIKWIEEKSGKALTFPLDEKLVASFLASLMSLNRKPDTVRSYKSAIVWYYKDKEQPYPELFDRRLEDQMAGYKRKCAKMKQNGEMDVFEGKHALTFNGYRIIAQRLMKLQPKIGRHSADIDENPPISTKNLTISAKYHLPMADIGQILVAAVKDSTFRTVIQS